MSRRWWVGRMGDSLVMIGILLVVALWILLIFWSVDDGNNDGHRNGNNDGNGGDFL